MRACGWIGPPGTWRCWISSTPSVAVWIESLACESSTSFAGGPGAGQLREARRAPDIRREPERIRDQYGRHLFGQTALVARRLVEAGAVSSPSITTRVTVTVGFAHAQRRREATPHADVRPGASGALERPERRGLLAETLVVAPARWVELRRRRRGGAVGTGARFSWPYWPARASRVGPPTARRIRTPPGSSTIQSVRSPWPRRSTTPSASHPICA